MKLLWYQFFSSKIAHEFDHLRFSKHSVQFKNIPIEIELETFESLKNPVAQW